MGDTIRIVQAVHLPSFECEEEYETQGRNDLRCFPRSLVCFRLTGRQECGGSHGYAWQDSVVEIGVGIPIEGQDKNRHGEAE